MINNKVICLLRHQTLKLREGLIIIYNHSNKLLLNGPAGKMDHF